MLKIYVVLLIFSLSGCVAIHSGNVSTGAVPECPRIYSIYGESKATYVLGIGGLNKSALILEAKENLYKSNKIKPSQKLSNFTLDNRISNFLLFSICKVIVSADVFDCDTSLLLVQKPNTESFEKPNIIEDKLLRKGIQIGDTIYVTSMSKYAYVTEFKSNKYLSAQILDSSNNKSEKRVLFEEALTTRKDLRNIKNFGYNNGQTVLITKYNPKTQQSQNIECKILALNINYALIEYTDEQKGKLKATVLIQSLFLNKKQ